MSDQQTRRVRGQRYGLAIGGVALAAMTVLGVAAHGAANDGDLLAGSGHGSTVAPHAGPSASGMTTGATVTESAATVSAAAPTLATSFAHPTL